MLFKTPAPTKKLKEICNILGSFYEIKTFDFEPVIYRDLHNGCEIEISRLNNNKRSFYATVHIWHTGKEIEMIPAIQSFKMLQDVLRASVEKYLQIMD